MTAAEKLTAHLDAMNKEALQPSGRIDGFAVMIAKVIGGDVGRDVLAEKITAHTGFLEKTSLAPDDDRQAHGLLAGALAGEI